MPEFTLAERLRTAHVTRFQIVRTIRQQTLAEHLFLVREFTNAFTRAAGFTVEESQIAEQWALEHDIPEVKTGDLATPVKVAMREAVPHDDPIRRIELSYSDSYAELYMHVKTHLPWVRDLVKMADLIEAVSFLEVEGVGVHAFKVRKDLWDVFCLMVDKCKEEYPHYNWQAVYDIARANTGA